MTLEEKVGQLCCFGWHGCTALDKQARICVEELHAGGMVVMGRNLHNTAERPVPAIDPLAVRTMLDSLQVLANIPLFLPTDQEGGRVSRFGTAPFTQMPAAGTLTNPQAAYEAAYQTGMELRTVGVNANFAPVADINSNPDNPVIGDRSFGATPEAVSSLVEAQVQGYAAAGILSCLKHFPGHGDTTTDSHLALPTLPYSLEDIRARELMPFVAGIHMDVPCIMTAHILFPTLDPTLPATLSPTILTDLLRKQLGFNGLIITDCLEMRAVANRWGTAHAALLAVQAGADMVLICHTLERQRETYETLLAAARSGELPTSRIDAAVKRILTAKQAIMPIPFDPSILRGTVDSTQVTRLGTDAP